MALLNSTSKSKKNIRWFIQLVLSLFVSYDPVDRIILERNHTIAGRTLEVQKALARDGPSRSRLAPPLPPPPPSRPIVHRYYSSNPSEFQQDLHYNRSDTNWTSFGQESVVPIDCSWCLQSDTYPFILVINRMIFGVRCDVVQRVTVQRSLVIILLITTDRVRRNTQVLVGPIGFNRCSLLNKTFLLLFFLRNKRKQSWRTVTHTHTRRDFYWERSNVLQDIENDQGKKRADWSMFCSREGERGRRFGTVWGASRRARRRRNRSRSRAETVADCFGNWSNRHRQSLQYFRNRHWSSSIGIAQHSWPNYTLCYPYQSRSHWSTTDCSNRRHRQSRKLSSPSR